MLLQNYTVGYNTAPGALRDTSTKVQVVPGLFEDSFPFGFWSNATGLIIGSTLYSQVRDFSTVTTSTVKADITSQVNFENLVKGGIEFDYYNLNFDYGIISAQKGQNYYSSRTLMQVFPYRGSAYVQDKLETKEFTMNAGLRLDLADANAHWWDVDPFDPVFFNPADSSTLANTKFPTKSSKMELDLEPRLGISHPISENAKLFFNYGWFRQLPVYETMFRVGRSMTGVMSSYGDPNLVLAKTISYELGVDYSVSESYLLQLAAYYNDVSDQQGGYNQQGYVNYISTSGFTYEQTSNNDYGDNKGFEVTLRKASGNWLNGFINYTYQVNTGGHFGPAIVYDNVQQQAYYDANTSNLYQNRPIPAPFARANLNFMSPNDFGPEVIGHHLFGAWMLNLVLDWQAGYWLTWNPNNVLNISYNVQTVDYFNAYLRLQKTINFGRASLQLFMDVNNVFNNKSNEFRNQVGGNIAYMKSLHLPANPGYSGVNIPGDDKVGDYRKPGVDWQPVQQQNVDQSSSPITDPSLLNNGSSIALYYNSTTGQYWWYNGTSGKRDGYNVPAGWSVVPQAKVSQVLSDKAYIQMPEQSTFWFLNPRLFYFGLTFSFNLSD